MHLGRWRSCACRTNSIQYDGMAFHCLFPLQHYDVVSLLCRINSFVTTKLVIPLLIE